ncbi:MAG: hypothetical protein J5529_01030 [Prevotella sp.]|nr:hypothetical protein [Prevotella sp.]
MTNKKLQRRVSKKRCLTLVSMLLSVCLQMTATDIRQTEHLTFYYPEFKSIDLSLGEMPRIGTPRVEFCCEAAFTGQRLSSFKHSNVADDHVSGGKWYKGYNCRANTGAFVWYGDKWAFMEKKKFLSEKPVCQMAFCQYLLILQGKQTPMWERMRRNKTRYRALCEKDGRLCLVESKKVITLEFFVKCLMESHVSNAIYLDMGAGWNYAWYRDTKGNPQEIFPESKQAADYRYRTNWVTFYR